MGESLRNDEAIYVAVNQNVRESKATLLWTLRNLHVKKLFLLHVHVPFSFTTSSTWLKHSEIDAIQEAELITLYGSLYKYRDICTNKGVSEEDVDISCISEDDVGEGIVKLIYQYNIKNLVMGAAADPHYYRGMCITSKKAEYVIEHAPPSCKMWFICKGKLITTRQGSLDLGNPSDSFAEFSGFAHKQSNGRGWYEDENETPKEHPDLKPKKMNKEPEKSKSNESEADSTPNPPHAYMCPITLEIMRDPHIAADGFTYEAEAMREHLNKGGQTSPMTNMQLKNYNLTPNRTLGTMIKAWLEKHPNYNID